MSASRRRVAGLYFLMQICFWGMLGAFAGYQAAILVGRGFSSGQAGTFISLSCLAGICSQPLLGGWADRHPECPLKYIFGLGMVLALGVQAIFYFNRPGFWGTALIFLLLGTLETNSYSLIDAMVMQYVNVGLDIPYSLGRGLGALSYAVVSVVVGQQAKRLGVESALVTHAVLLVLLIVITAFFPAFSHPAGSRPQTRQARPHSALQVLRANPPFTLMLLAGFFGMASMLPQSSFMVDIVTSRGGNSGDLGLALFLMAASELPGAIVFQHLWKRLGIERVMLLSLCFVALRPLLQLATASLGPLLAVQPVQMLGYGMFIPAAVYFTNENVAKEDRVQGQTLKMVGTTGLGGVVGNLVMGRVIESSGVDTALWVLTVSGVLGVVLCVLSIRLRRRRASV